MSSNQQPAFTDAWRFESESRKDVPESSLLCLPCEVRNQIYGYALSSSGILHYKTPSPIKKDTYHIFIDSETHGHQDTVRYLPFNQLRNVSRQLRFETEDLEIQFNTLMFSVHDKFNIAPDVQLLRFVESLHPSKRRWLTSVALSPHLAKTYDQIWVDDILGRLKLDVKSLANFCAEHPRVRIKYIISPWNPTDQYLSVIYPHLTSCGVFFEILFHGNDLSHILPADFYTIYLVRKARLEQDFGIECRGQAPNLRIYPGTIKLRPEEEYCIRQNIIITRGGAANYVEEWFRQAKRWVKHGI